ncbi:O-antigen ligase [Clostridium punense]|uniref:O-antigen ligase n=2 Tax=Clostridium TaxID=1485 RepID=A0ABS4K076_9CLOT|nr:O-antigen ligase family protein [Clostridium punense]MBP2021175.1 O-antigen ligase [Clostridium punense]
MNTAIEKFKKRIINFCENKYFKVSLLFILFLLSSGLQIVDKIPMIGKLDGAFFISAALLLTIASLIKGRENNYINIFILLLGGLSFLSVLWSIEPVETFKNSILFISTSIIAIYIGQNYKKSEIFRMLMFWFILLMVANLIAIIFKFPGIYQIDETRYESAIKGLFRHRNSLGLYMAFGGSMSLWFLLQFKDNNKIKSLYAINLLGSIVLLYLSKSMTAMLLGVSFLLLVIITRYKKVSKVLIYSIIPVLIGAVYFLVYQPQWFKDFLLAIGRNPTLTGRSLIWQGAVKAIEYKAFIGYGYGSFWTINPYSVLFILPIYRSIPVNAHNGFMDIMIDFGIIGAIIVFIWLGLTLRKTKKLMDYVSERNYKYLSFSLAYFLFILMYNLFETVFIRQKSVIYITLIIFANMVYRISKEEK